LPDDFKEPPESRGFFCAHKYVEINSTILTFMAIKKFFLRWYLLASVFIFIAGFYTAFSRCTNSKWFDEQVLR